MATAIEACTEEGIISRNPEIVSGAPVFPGTRVQIQQLRDYLATGAPLGRFLEDCPEVSKAQAVKVIDFVFEHAVGLPAVGLPSEDSV